MSQAYQCDACSEFFKREDVPSLDSEKFTGSQFRYIEPQILMLKDPVNDITMSIDICPKCLNEIHTEYFTNVDPDELDGNMIWDLPEYKRGEQDEQL